MMAIIEETQTVKTKRVAREHGPATLVIRYTLAFGKMTNSMVTENYLTTVHCKLKLARQRYRNHTT